jgi:hypothetical protein
MLVVKTSNTTVLLKNGKVNNKTQARRPAKYNFLIETFGIRVRGR